MTPVTPGRATETSGGLTLSGALGFLQFVARKVFSAAQRDACNRVLWILLFGPPPLRDAGITDTSGLTDRKVDHDRDEAVRQSTERASISDLP